MTLQERIEQIRKSGRHSQYKEFTPEDDLVLAHYINSTGKENFDRWVDAHKITEGELTIALSGKENELPPITDPPDWLQLLIELFAEEHLASSVSTYNNQDSLSTAASPFVHWGNSQLSKLAATIHYYGKIDIESFQKSAIQCLEANLSRYIFKPIVLEINIARISEKLVGDTEEDRQRYFISQYLNVAKNLRTILFRYPALLRIMAITALNWKRINEELATRFLKDQKKIQELLFAGKRPIKLLSYSNVLSDAHAGGQTVLIIELNGKRKLVYKPRDLRVDAAFAKFVDNLVRIGHNPTLQSPKVILSENYGWAEFITTAELFEPDHATKFYERLGSLLAILYLLSGTDFHAENLIASGDQPVLVDLETLLHSDTMDVDDETTPLAMRLLHRSVFRAGILPTWSVGDPKIGAADVSGIVNLADQVALRESEVLKQQDGDDVHFDREPIPLESVDNQPTFRGRQVDPTEYTLNLRQGFARTYKLFRQNAQNLQLSAAQLFEAVEVRHVIRPTMLYGTLLQRSLHPDFLRDTIHREIELSRLFGVNRSESLDESVLLSEMCSLINGDIPIFRMRANSKALFDHNALCVDIYARKTAIELLIERFEKISERDMVFQDNIIELSMSTLVKRRKDIVAYEDVSHLAHMPSAEECENASLCIANELCESALYYNTSVDWLGLRMIDDDQYSLGTIGHNLYDGVGGVGLFLAYMARYFDDDKYINLSNCCASRLIEQLESDSNNIGGGFSGKMSVCYSLLHIGSALERDDYLDRAYGFVNAANIDPTIDENFDIMSGSAGVIATLLAMHEVRQEDQLLGACCRVADYLIDKQIEQENGWAWPSKYGVSPLTGFSHGAAGISWALTRLGSLIGNEQYLLAAKRGFAYERGLYNSAINNWPDNRISLGSKSDRFQMCAWCHGATGIGLSRLTLPTECIGLLEKQEIEKSVSKVLETCSSADDCLCHGVLGDIELLSCYNRQVADHSIRSRMNLMLADLIERHQSGAGWRCGSPAPVKVLGLLTGIAGIGYGILRVQRPESFPSVLLLEPPLIRAH